MNDYIWNDKLQGYVWYEEYKEDYLDDEIADLDILSVEEYEEYLCLYYTPLIEKVIYFNKGKNNYEVDDIKQELYLVLLRCIRNFDADKGASFSSYFVKSAINKINDLRGQYFKHNHLSLDNMIDDDTSFLDLLESNFEEEFSLDRKEEILAKLETLPFGDLTIQYFFENKTQKELAKEYNLSKGYVNKKIRENVRELRNFLKGV